MLKLYHMWPSTCSKKVRICLAEKQIDWESVVIKTSPGPENLEAWYVALNPNGVVPTLDHDGNIIIESCVILEYLEDVFPEIRLRPEDPVARARMRVWLDRSESILHKYINVLSHNRFMSRYLAHLSLEDKLAMAGRQPRIAMLVYCPCTAEESRNCAATSSCVPEMTVMSYPNSSPPIVETRQMNTRNKNCCRSMIVLSAGKA